MIVARDVYGAHYDDLTITQKGRVAELLALRVVEIEYEKDALDRIRNS